MVRNEQPANHGSSRLSSQAVVTAAIALADRDGIDAITMRKLAAMVGSGAMSLYYYFPNKVALLDAMVDVVFSEIEPPSTELEWRAALRRRAISTREALRRHPWAIGRMEATKTPGPADLRLHDAVLGCLRQAGFSVEAAVQAYSVQDAYIYGFALQEKALPFATQADFASSAQERVHEVEARLEDALRTYPHLAEVVGGYIAREGFSFPDAFEIGLDVILDGLERLRSASET